MKSFPVNTKSKIPSLLRAVRPIDVVLSTCTEQINEIIDDINEVLLTGATYVTLGHNLSNEERKIIMRHYARAGWEVMWQTHNYTFVFHVASQKPIPTPIVDLSTMTCSIGSPLPNINTY